MNITSHPRLLAAIVPVALGLGTVQCDAPAMPVPERDATVATATVPGPDGTEITGRCTQYEELLLQYAPPRGWDVERMSRLAWRESNCWPEIRSRTSDTGLLQINDIGLPFLTETLGEPVDQMTLNDPVQNIRAAAALCDFWASHGQSCYQPWGR